MNTSIPSATTQPMLQVRPIRSPDELNQVQRLRYQICCIEHGHTHLEGTNHQEQVIADYLDHDLTVFGVFRDGLLVGTVRWGLMSWTKRPHRNTSKLRALGFRNPAQIGVSDRLALDPNTRSLSVLQAIYKTVSHHALSAGSVHEFCWAGRRLSQLYSLLGYRRTGVQIINGAGDPLDILQLDLRSPFNTYQNNTFLGGGFATPFTPQAA